MTDPVTQSTRTTRGPTDDPGYQAAHFRFVPGRVAVWREVARALQADVPRDAVLLDLGAGYGYFVNAIEARERHALDRSPSILDHAAPGVTPHVGDCTDLSRFGDGSFDVVFAGHLLEHLTREQVDATLGEVRRVLRPGGRLLVLQPNFRRCVREYFDDYTHVTVFTDHSLRHWLEARGFRVRKLVPGFLPGDSRSSRPTWPLLVRLYLRLPLRPFAQQMYCVAERPGP